MNRSIFILFISCSHFIFSQTPCGDSAENWHLENGNSYTSLNFNIPDNDSIADDSITSVSKLLYFFTEKKGVENIIIKDNAIDFNVYNINQDFTNYGYSKKDLSFYTYDPLSFHCTVEPHAGKYNITYTQIAWNLNAQLSSDKVIMNFDYFNKKGCIALAHKKNINNDLNLLQRFFQEWSRLNQADIVINSLKISPIANPQKLTKEIIIPSPEYQYQLIANAGQCLKKSQNNKIASAIFLGAGSLVFSMAQANGSRPGKLLGGTSALIGFGCGISAIVWQYRAANYLIKVSPTSASLTF